MSTDQTKRPEARKPRGFPDRTAAVIAAERRLVDSISAVYARWGFEDLPFDPKGAMIVRMIDLEKSGIA